MKYAIVTGGTKGIGKQITKELLARNYFVFITFGNDEVEAKRAALDFGMVSDHFEIFRADQRNPEKIKLFIDSIHETKCELDVVVLNAGITHRGGFLSTEEKEWEDVFRANVHSSFLMVKGLYDQMVVSGSIVFIGSLMGLYPHSMSLPYGVSKAAVEALAKNLVKELSPKKIRVNTLVPGFVDTDWQNQKPQEIRKNIEDKIAIGRFAHTTEIAHACMFLIESGYMNGATLVVDGGYCYK